MKKTTGSLRDLRRLIRFLDAPIRSVALLASLLFMDAMNPVAQAFSLKWLVDSVASRNASVLLRSSAVYLVVAAASAAYSGAGISLRVSLVETLARRQRQALAESVVNMPLSVSERHARGDLASRLTSDISASSRALTECYLVARSVLQAATSAAYMLILNWQVALACAAVGPIIISVSGLLARPINRRSSAFQEAIGEASSHALNTLEGAAIVKSFCAEGSMGRRFMAKAEAIRRAGVRLTSSLSLNVAWGASASFLPFLVTFGYGGHMALQGRLSVGGILALVNLTNNLAWPFGSMGQSVASVQKSLGAFRRVAEILDEPKDADPEGNDATTSFVAPDSLLGKVGRPEPSGEASLPAIAVKHLTFEYAPGDPVLTDVSFRVDPGSLVVLAGKSGCGKSTLLKILAGLYRPGPGTVHVGGLDIHYGAATWGRKRVAYVPQEPFLFAGSLRENLELGKPGASEAEAAAALEVADALDFVNRIDGGLDADVSERGGTLSGGERQRFCIARTLLRGGSVLLLDEPTSSVDKKSEERVWLRLREVMEGKTCVAATHRLDIAKEADLILVMDGGRIVESGSHDQLLRPGSLYSLLVGDTGGESR